MEFGSKFVYRYSDSEEESVSEEEYETGFAHETILAPPTRSSSVEKSAKPDNHLPPKLPAKKAVKWMPPKCKSLRQREAAPAPPKPPSNASSKSWRRADTNVVAIKFDHLAQPCNMHTGDSVKCEQCAAFMSHISKLQGCDDQQVWECEFCGARNHVEVLPGELPTTSDVTYLIKPAPSTTGSNSSGADETMVVFCIDTSGSMCVSQEVRGQLNLRGNHADRFRSLNTTGENQWMPGQNRNVTYVTRLQSLQAAVDHQLEVLAKDYPHRRVALVTFNSEVTVVGDGRSTPVVVAGDKLNSFDELLRIGSSLDTPMNISLTRASLGKLVFDLEEGGQTALGPAMLLAITMASKSTGSKVIMCTDGMANVGLGSLDGLSDEQYKIAAEFYGTLAETAKDKGVTVSVLTIAGTDCKLVELGRVASETGGQVDIVDPLKLTDEFSNILANPVIATHVTATFVVHKGLYIRGESKKTSWCVQDVGNVTKDSEITFDYGVRRDDKKKSSDEKGEGAEAETEAGAGAGAGAEAEAEAVGGAAAAATAAADSQPKELPFQVQIRYTDVEGAVALRVLTQTLSVTKSREQAERYINVPVIGCHATKKSSEMALKGAYTHSRLNAFMYQRLVHRNAQDEDYYGIYCDNIAPLEYQVRSAQQLEARSCGLPLATYETEEFSDDDETYDRVGANASAKAPTSSSGGLRSRVAKLFSGHTTRRKTCSDQLSKEIYQKQAISRSAFESSSSSSPSDANVLPSSSPSLDELANEQRASSGTLSQAETLVSQDEAEKKGPNTRDRSN